MDKLPSSATGHLWLGSSARSNEIYTCGAGIEPPLDPAFDLAGLGISEAGYIALGLSIQYMCSVL